MPHKKPEDGKDKSKKKVNPDKNAKEDMANINKEFNPIRETTLVLEY